LPPISSQLIPPYLTRARRSRGVVLRLDHGHDFGPQRIKDVLSRSANMLSHDARQDAHPRSVPLTRHGRASGTPSLQPIGACCCRRPMPAARLEDMCNAALVAASLLLLSTAPRERRPVRCLPCSVLRRCPRSRRRDGCRAGSELAGAPQATPPQDPSPPLHIPPPHTQGAPSCRCCQHASRRMP